MQADNHDPAHDDDDGRDQDGDRDRNDTDNDHEDASNMMAMDWDLFVDSVLTPAATGGSRAEKAIATLVRKMQLEMSLYRTKPVTVDAARDSDLAAYSPKTASEPVSPFGMAPASISLLSRVLDALIITLPRISSPDRKRILDALCIAYRASRVSMVATARAMNKGEEPSVISQCATDNPVCKLTCRLL